MSSTFSPIPGALRAGCLGQEPVTQPARIARPGGKKTHARATHTLPSRQPRRAQPAHATRHARANAALSGPSAGLLTAWSNLPRSPGRHPSVPSRFSCIESSPAGICRRGGC